jgi:hypothetical protein
VQKFIADNILYKMIFTKIEDIELKGIILPGAGSCVLHELHIQQIHRIKETFLLLLKKSIGSRQNNSLKLLYGRLYESCLQLSEIEQINIFDHPFAAYYLHHSSQRQLNKFPIQVVGLFGGRIPGLHIIIPANTIPATGITFPHLNIQLFPSGLSISIRQTGSVTEIVWADGMQLTIDTYVELSKPSFNARYTVSYFIGPFQYLNYFSDYEELSFPDLTQHCTSAENSIIKEGYYFLDRIWHEAASDVSQFLKQLILLRYNRKFTRSMTTSEIPNTLIATFSDLIQAGDAMAHEVSHVRLNYLLEKDKIISNGYEAVHPSPWRQDLRPLTGILNGVHAFINVYHYYLRAIKSKEAKAIREILQRILEDQHKKIFRGWEYLIKHSKPTPLGKRIIGEMEFEIQKIK